MLFPALTSNIFIELHSTLYVRQLGTYMVTKYERICLLAGRILEKCIRIFEYDVFLKSIFVVFHEIVYSKKLEQPIEFTHALKKYEIRHRICTYEYV